jgi:hypothetical protein
MFADDVALVADTISGLQQELNILQEFCENFALTVNLEKTKIMVYKNGGRLSNREKWTFQNKQIDIVNSFTYVGVTFTPGLSPNRMALEQTIKAKCALLALLKNLQPLGQLSHSIFFKLFDSKVLPILLYGSELWGQSRYDSVERVLSYACKRFLCVDQLSPNAPVLADCGRFPVYIESCKRVVKYWLRILKMPQTRYVKLCYDMLLTKDTLGANNWVTKLRQMLQTNGFGYIWASQKCENENYFIALFSQRMTDQYLQSFYSILENSHKLIVYKHIKNNYLAETYCDVLSIKKFRHFYAQFRTGKHFLEIERGRYDGKEKGERICRLCNYGNIEDEFHFVLVCHIYSDLRIRYLPNDFLTLPTFNKLYRLLSSKNETTIRNLSLYLYHAYHRRENILSIL